MSVSVAVSVVVAVVVVGGGDGGCCCWRRWRLLCATYNIPKRFLKNQGKISSHTLWVVITQVVGHIQYSYMRLAK